MITLKNGLLTVAKVMAWTIYSNTGELPVPLSLTYPDPSSKTKVCLLAVNGKGPEGPLRIALASNHGRTRD